MPHGRKLSNPVPDAISTIVATHPSTQLTRTHMFQTGFTSGNGFIGLAWAATIDSNTNERTMLNSPKTPNTMFSTPKTVTEVGRRMGARRSG